MSAHKYYQRELTLAGTPPNPQQELLALVLTSCFAFAYISLTLTT
jgi:hypothetical protein